MDSTESSHRPRVGRARCCCQSLARLGKRSEAALEGGVVLLTNVCVYSTGAGLVLQLNRKLSGGGSGGLSGGDGAVVSMEWLLKYAF